jgi:two-component system nitrogen regulation response regulator GlnG
MAAIPRDLIEAELFGHEKGAFTGAVGRVAGRFEQARGGTLFLDEIGDMPMEAQTRLLRVLQSGEFSPVGGTRPIKSDVRIIAATHQDLPQLVADGRFRQDLYFRLNVIPVAIPPLRDRRSDIPDLVRHFLAGAADAGLPTKSIMPDAVDLLTARDWPGNVRELGNYVQRLVLLSRDDVIRAQDVAAMPEVTGETVAGSDDRSPDARIAQLLGQWTQARLREGDKHGDLYSALLELVERPLIAEILKHHGGSQLRAAKAMGINRNTLRKKMEAAGISSGRR